MVASTVYIQEGSPLLDQNRSARSFSQGFLHSHYHANLEHLNLIYIVKDTKITNKKNRFENGIKAVLNMNEKITKTS